MAGLKGWLGRLLHTGEAASGDAVAAADTYSEVRAYIQFHQMDAWWLEAFSAAERAIIEARYASVGRQPGHMLSSELTNSGQSPFGFLSGLMVCLDPLKHRVLVHRVFEKAASLSGRHIRVSDQHFLYDAYLTMLTRDHSPDEADVARLVAACEAMIGLAPLAAEAFRTHGALPGHRGYEWLGQHCEAEGRHGAAMAMYQQARAQGWSGRWDAGILRCKRASGEG